MKLFTWVLVIAICFQKGDFLEWEPLGCYQDLPDRAMGHHFETATYDEANPDFEDMFEQCRVKAEKLEYTYFGVQDMSECWGSYVARKTYDKHGCTDNCLRGISGYGVGSTWSNFVYRVKKDWTDCRQNGCVQNMLVITQDNGPKCPPYNKQVKKSDVTRPCPNDDNCVSVNGGWSGFSRYSTCTKTCGGGVMERTRSCTNPPPAHGGNDCVGVSKMSSVCNTQACPVEGGWSDYGAWTACTRSCDGGTHSRVRDCNNPRPSAGGSNCLGSSIEREPCNEQPCTENIRNSVNVLVINEALLYFFLTSTLVTLFFV